MLPQRNSDRATTGVPGLDDVLDGGLVSHQLYLVDGNPGAGKTTLALQFLLEGRRAGERCLYVTLSESRAELAAGAASHGWVLDGIEVLELATDLSNLGAGELTMFNPSEVELTETTRRVLDMFERMQPQRMVLDSLSELRLLAQTSLRYRRQILALKQFFSGRGCTVLLLDDRTAEVRDLQLQSIAHGVISLDHEAPPYGPARRRLNVAKFRGSNFRSGYQDMAIRAAGVEVYPRLVASEHIKPFARDVVASGVQRLDALLGGGIERGTSTLLVGPAGCGKSTITLQYAAAAAGRGDHVAVFLFEESRVLLLARAAGLGMSIHEGEGPGRVSLTRVDPSAISPGEFAQAVRRAVDHGGARVIVIDSLNGLLNTMPAGQSMQAQLHELLTYLGNKGVATFLVAAQSGVLGLTMRAPIDTSYLADTVVLFRMFEHLGAVKKSVAVIKKRSGRHEESIRELWFDADGVHLSDPLLHLRGVLSGVPEETAVHLPDPTSGAAPDLAFPDAANGGIRHDE